jgi:hypothetical protein
VVPPNFFGGGFYGEKVKSFSINQKRTKRKGNICLKNKIT